MQTVRQAAGSFLLALCSAVLVIGGISLALAEVYIPATPTPTETQELLPVILSPTQEVIVAVAETLTPSPSATIPPPTSCPPPANWIPVTVQSGEDLALLALRYKTNPDVLSRANCLFSTNLRAGSILYVPPIPTATTIPCGPPAGWVSYTVKFGDTLYSLSHAYGVSIAQLQFANCLPASQYNISIGQILRVPFVAITRTPLPTATATLTRVSIIFPTVTGTTTITPTETIIPILTSTPTATATATPTSTTTATPTATVTVVPPTTPPTATATITAFPTDTRIP